MTRDTGPYIYTHMYVYIYTVYICIYIYVYIYIYVKLCKYSCSPLICGMFLPKRRSVVWRQTLRNPPPRTDLDGMRTGQRYPKCLGITTMDSMDL